jgi:hypothetical protein
MTEVLRQRREKMIKVLREEGARAFREGKPVSACPFRYMDAFQWRIGYDEAKGEQNDSAKSSD